MKTIPLLLFGLSLYLVATTPAAASTDQWTTPTPEELAMTAIPQVPGANAVVLYKEQVADSREHTILYYYRIKILSDKGKDFANVELPYSGDNAVKVDQIAGRTIHPDGSVVPFTGKPFERVVEKTKGYKLTQKLFSLPAVELGSIIEYRYRENYASYLGIDEDWYIQHDLFIRKAHYSWVPGPIYTAPGDPQIRIAWTPILPAGAQVQKSTSGPFRLTLDIDNVPPLPHDDMMPPLGSVSYRVLFYYTQYKTVGEFWTGVGALWSKAHDEFIGPGPAIRAAVPGLVSPGDTDEQKARKLYAAVLSMENTDFSRQRTEREDKVKGLKTVSTADDILQRRRGTADQLAHLYVAMARAAGLKAYIAGVADRSRRLFMPNYLTVGQLDDYIAIVPLDGKDVYLDPGQPACPFGQLAWFHEVTGGLRQTGDGTQVLQTPPGNFNLNHRKRIADLALDEHGIASGTVHFIFEGEPALRLRQMSIMGDEKAVSESLRTGLEELLPTGVEVSVDTIDNLNDPARPLDVTYNVHGAIGSATGKRLILPAHLFESTATPRFPEAQRAIPIDLRASVFTQDAVRYKLPAGYTVESMPTEETEKFKNSLAFDSLNKLAPDAITLFRDFMVSQVIVPAADYPALHSFYSKLSSKDQEMLVLTRGDHVAAASNGTQP